MKKVDMQTSTMMLEDDESTDSKKCNAYDYIRDQTGIA